MLPNRILAHRGLWSSAQQKNSLEALMLALSRGYGLETDIRDRASELVISHDPPTASAPCLHVLLEEYRRLDAQGMLAFNIKADGLATELKNLLQAYGIERFFVFDMSIPDMLHYNRLQLPFFARRSEIETYAIEYDACAGIWLDAFTTDWYKPDTIFGMISAGKQVAVVSPELHRRDHRMVWRMLREISDPRGLLYCCTDYPEELQRWLA
jgi:hypothetical protein